MAKDLIDYKARMLDAMRGLVSRLLDDVARDGLPGEHHFYITFLTRYPGVEIPDSLLARFPEEMTIILQHQFWGLEVTEDGFFVTLSFSRQPQRLFVPFAAVTTFVDPSVQFGLQFKEEGDDAEPLPLDADDDGRSEEERIESESDEAPPAAEKVVTLDAFRKK
ncbi:MAG: hypothetical protein CMM50_11270 [Rhodospirillaceae bacterium]|nr:hypothetical protein [Rhodospirillaceae bacterium]|tara:strand:- start:996 stop:1487 length:492 start_codon:yes stop_codon:yes gene_type:complete